MHYYKALVAGKKLFYAVGREGKEVLAYNIDGSDPEVRQLSRLDVPVEISYKEYHRLLRIWFAASELKQLTADIDTHNWITLVPTYSRQCKLIHKQIQIVTVSGRIRLSDADADILSALIDKLLTLPDQKLNVITVPLNHRGHTLHSVKIMPGQNVVYWGCTDRETDEFISYSGVIPFDALETMLCMLDGFRDLIE